MSKSVLGLSALAAAALAFAGAAFSQDYGTGLIFEEDITAKIPQRAVLLTRSYESIPRSHSLKKYAPEILSQGRYGTCNGWASGYAARTIAEACANGWTNRETISAEAYSAIFLYSMVRRNPGCEKGTVISDAMKALKEVGAVKMRDVEDECLSDVPARLLPKAGAHRIDAYWTTFSQDDPPNFRVHAVRKAISEDKPVVIGMTVYESFFRVGAGGVWNGFTTTAGRGGGGHAMCVIGYDDDKEGGAFEIMNSWGTRWGDGGFVWVKYADFGKHAWYGADIHVRPKQQRADTVVNTVVSMSGSLQFKLSSGVEMKAVLQNKGGLPTYRMTRGYISGTKFRIYLSNDNPAYVYVIGSDLNNDVSKIFPHNERTSAALFYKKNDIALPDEEHLFELDGTAGTTYALVLYSQKELPIDEIADKIRKGGGNFTQKTKNAVGADLIPFNEMSLEPESIKFSSKSRKTVMAIVVETDHKASGY